MRSQRRRWPRGESGGDVQQPVAQRLRLGLGESRGVVQQHCLRPCDEVSGDQDGGQPCGIDVEPVRREPAQPGVLGAADSVFDSGVRAVPSVESGQLPDSGGGGEGGVALAIALFEQVELRAGVRVFPACDDPHPFGVVGQRGGWEQPRQLSHDWSLARQVIAEEGACRDCGHRLPGQPLICDHIVPRALGGTDDRSNLTRRCRRHNSARARSPRSPREP
jgi:HNH endonuclease